MPTTNSLIVNCHVTYQEIKILLEHPAAGLLRSQNAALVLGFLSHAFKAQHWARLPEGQLRALLDAYGQAGRIGALAGGGGGAGASWAVTVVHLPGGTRVEVTDEKQATLTGVLVKALANRLDLYQHIQAVFGSETDVQKNGVPFIFFKPVKSQLTGFNAFGVMAALLNQKMVWTCCASKTGRIGCVKIKYVPYLFASSAWSTLVHFNAVSAGPLFWKSLLRQPVAF